MAIVSFIRDLLGQRPPKLDAQDTAEPVPLTLRDPCPCCGGPMRIERAVGFQIPIGLPDNAGEGLCFRPISPRDMPPGNLLLGQMRGRVLSVATSRFADQVALALAGMQGD